MNTTALFHQTVDGEMLKMNKIKRCRQIKIVLKWKTWATQNIQIIITKNCILIWVQHFYKIGANQFIKLWLKYRKRAA